MLPYLLQIQCMESHHVSGSQDSLSWPDSCQVQVLKQWGQHFEMVPSLKLTCSPVKMMIFQVRNLQTSRIPYLQGQAVSFREGIYLFSVFTKFVVTEVHCTIENYVLFYIYIALKLNMILWKKAWTRTSSMNQFSFTRSNKMFSIPPVTIFTWPLPFRNLNMWFLFSNVFKGQIPFPRLAWVFILVMPARAGGKNAGILGTCHGTWKPKKSRARWKTFQKNSTWLRSKPSWHSFVLIVIPISGHYTPHYTANKWAQRHSFLSWKLQRWHGPHCEWSQARPC